MMVRFLLKIKNKGVNYIDPRCLLQKVMLFLFLKKIVELQTQLALKTLITPFSLLLNMKKTAIKLNLNVNILVILKYPL